MVRGITLDAFGTLIDTGRDVLLKVSRAALEDHGRGVAPEAFLEVWDRHFFGANPPEFLNLAEITEDSLARTFRDFGIEGDPAPYVDMLDAEWRRAKPYPEVAAALDALDGLPRAVVSNADEAFLREILERNSLAFDAVITSEATRCYKPRPAIFEAALQALGMPAQDIVHVGDSLTADVAGAGRLGMRTIWLNRSGVGRGPGDPVPDAEIRTLAPLADLLKRL